MNTFSQNRYNMRYKQTMPWNQNVRPQGQGYTPRKHFLNSPWPSQSLPGSENYWCETCDKGFRTRTLLYYHTQHHQKCNIDGCEFIAHPKVITKHIQMQHATGLYKRIGKLNNPEEIKKWREERKRKYPTKENIEKRQAEIKEKIRRGEKMGLKHDRRGINTAKSGIYIKRQPNMTHNKKFKTLNNKNNLSQSSIKKRPTKKIAHEENPEKEESRKLQPFRGIQDFVFDDVVEDHTPEECNDLIEDDEDMADVKVADKTNSNPILCGALTSLICSYESTDEEDIKDNTKTTSIKTSNSLSETNKEKTTKSNNANNNVNDCIESKELLNINGKNLNPQNITTCRNGSDNDSGPEEITASKDEPTINDDLKPTKCLPSRKDRGKKYESARTRHRVNLKRKLPSTLLEKLLHKEIQYERNVILQCIRYVVKNKYFDKS